VRPAAGRTARAASGQQDGVVPLLVFPCRQRCDWTAVEQRPHGRLFACNGCGSQWERGQGWTPRQADGTQPPGIAAELRRPADAAGSAGS